jgi:hypothetical protein
LDELWPAWLAGLLAGAGGVVVDALAALAGNCRTQPGQTTEGSVNRWPSPMSWPRLSLTISENRSPSPR